MEMPETRQWSLTYERRLPFDSSLRINYNGNHIPNNLKYALGNLPLSPLNGPVVVANHPNNAPAAGFPDLRGKTIDRVAADINCAGTGLPGLGVNAACPVVVPIADNEISLRVPRTNERRPDPRYGSNLIVSNDAKSWYDGIQIEWLKRLGDGLQITTSYTRSRSLDTTSEATFVGAGDSNQQGPNAAYAKGYSRFHTPHRFSFNSTYLLVRGRIGATSSATPLAAGRRRASSAYVGIAVHGVADVSTWTSTSLPRPGRSCSTRPSPAAPSTIATSGICCRSAPSGRMSPAIRWTRSSAATRSSATG